MGTVMSEATSASNSLFPKQMDKPDTLPDILDARLEEPLRARISKDRKKPENHTGPEIKEEPLSKQEDEDLEKFMLVYFKGMNDSSISNFLERTIFKDLDDNEVTIIDSEEEEEDVKSSTQQEEVIEDPQKGSTPNTHNNEVGSDNLKGESNPKDGCAKLIPTEEESPRNETVQTALTMKVGDEEDNKDNTINKKVESSPENDRDTDKSRNTIEPCTEAGLDDGAGMTSLKPQQTGKSTKNGGEASNVNMTNKEDEILLLRHKVFKMCAGEGETTLDWLNRL